MSFKLIKENWFYAKGALLECETMGVCGVRLYCGVRKGFKQMDEQGSINRC